jgi:hypothetical protein
VKQHVCHQDVQNDILLLLPAKISNNVKVRLQHSKRMFNILLAKLMWSNKVIFYPLGFMNRLYNNRPMWIYVINKQVILSILVLINHESHIKPNTLQETSNKRTMIKKMFRSLFPYENWNLHAKITITSRIMLLLLSLLLNSYC